jgi:hypothetical protein
LELLPDKLELVLELLAVRVERDDHGGNDVGGVLGAACALANPNNVASSDMIAAGESRCFLMEAFPLNCPKNVKYIIDFYRSLW